MRTTGLRIEHATSLERLSALGAQWQALLDRAIPGRDFFLRAESLAAFAPIHASPVHRGGVRTPCLLLAWRGEALVGAMPMVHERKALRKSGLRRLLLWGGERSALGAETEVPIRPDDPDPAGVAAAFRAALAGPLGRTFDLLELGNLREDGTSLPWLRQAFADGAWSDEPFAAYSCSLEQSFAAYRASRSGGRLREFGRLRRKLEATGRLVIREVDDLDDAAFAQVMALHDARQAQLQGRGGELREVVFSPPHHAAAVRALLRAAAATGRGRHRLLYDGEQLVSFLLSFESGGTLTAWLTSVHADYLAFGAGSVLFWEVVQREFARGSVRRIDFGYGRTFLKETLSTDVRRPQHLLWQPPGHPLAALRWTAYRALTAGRDRVVRGRG